MEFLEEECFGHTDDVIDEFIIGDEVLDFEESDAPELVIVIDGDIDILIFEDVLPGG